MSELSIIEKNTRQLLDKYASLPDSLGVLLYPNASDLALPALCLVSAKAVGDMNGKIIHLAEIFCLMGMAFRLHCGLPKAGLSGDEDAARHSLLVGDLLYSQVYYNICRNGLSNYLLYFTHLISGLHESVLRREEGRAQAMLHEAACFLGADAAGGKNTDKNETAVHKWAEII